MFTASVARITRERLSSSEAVFLLENGTRMDRETFHGLYRLTPEGFRAELIGGVVHVSSPVSAYHGKPHARLVGLLILYMEATPGTDVFDNTTTFLNEENEPQPDASLLIQRRYGGQTSIDKKGYIIGPAELIVEIANSSASIDLGRRFEEYRLAGVKEYLVITVQERRFYWFSLNGGGYQPLPVRPDGVMTSVVFPGLWIHPRLFFSANLSKGFAITRKGLSSPEHAAFVADLAARRKKFNPKKKSRKK